MGLNTTPSSPMVAHPCLPEPSEGRDRQEGTLEDQNARFREELGVDVSTAYPLLQHFLVWPDRGLAGQRPCPRDWMLGWGDSCAQGWGGVLRLETLQPSAELATRTPMLRLGGGGALL